MQQGMHTLPYMNLLLLRVMQEATCLKHLRQDSTPT